MVKTWIKHKIAEISFDIFSSKFISNFQKNKFGHDFNIGQYYWILQTSCLSTPRYNENGKRYIENTNIIYYGVNILDVGDDYIKIGAIEKRIIKKIIMVESKSIHNYINENSLNLVDIIKVKDIITKQKELVRPSFFTVREYNKEIGFDLPEEYSP